MSDRVGPIDYSQTEDMLFGGEVVSRRNYSEAIALEIDQEVKRLIEECYARARVLLEERGEVLRRLVSALLVREVLDNEQVDTILAGKPLPDVPAKAKPAATAPAAPADPTKQPDGEAGDLRGRPAPDLVS
jgi:cell division protease FtsH